MENIKNKRTILYAIALTVIFFSQLILPVSATEPEPGVLILKVDRNDAIQMPKDFRKASDSFKRSVRDGKLPSRTGMDKLQLSGSSYFSQLEFAKMVTKLPVDRLVILDLRGESHGYLDGMGVSWYSAYKRANFGKNAAEVEAIERDLLKSTLNAPVNVARQAADKSVISTTERKVTNAITEGDLAAAFDVKYYRIPVADYTPPSNENVEQFLQFYKALPKDAWLHLHCEAGEGRTTTFMAMVDMLHNAKKVSYDDIMTRQWLLGGQDIRTATSKDPWKAKAYVERAKFTRDFYDYVVQNPGLEVSWTQWIRQHR
ncbi:Effector protein hopD2 [Sporomusa rhizae]|uniref:phosphatase domain-containing putative toxin n=1 Tax=Sporomusa rhizae TaxID=357999 RepID=UPI00352A8470